MKSLDFINKTQLKKSRLFIFIALACLVFVGCEDIIEEEPRGFRSEVPSEIEIEELQDFVNALYDLLQKKHLYKETGYHSNWGDIGVDVLGSSSFGSFNPLYVYTYEPSVKVFSETWSEHYQAILQTNLSLNLYSGLLDTLEKDFPEEEDQQRFKNYIGGIYFVRAMLYFNLVRMYESPVIVGGEPPETVTELINEEDPTNSTPREVYDFIISDLNNAIGLLADSNLTEYGEASNSAAQALLGKVNLTIAGFLKHNVALDPSIYDFPNDADFYYEEAIKRFDTVISSNNYELMSEYGKIFDPTEEDKNKEAIFFVRYETTGNKGGSDFGITFGVDGAGTNGSGAFNPFSPLREFSVSFFDNKSHVATGGPDPDFPELNDTDFFNIELPMPVSDSRFLETISTYSIRNVSAGDPPTKETAISDWGPNLWGIYKYQRELPINIAITEDRPNDFPYMRYAEVLLMKAECLLKSNKNQNVAEAVELINQIRRRAFRVNREGANTGDELFQANLKDDPNGLGLENILHNLETFSDDIPEDKADRVTIKPGVIDADFTGLDIDIKTEDADKAFEALMREYRKEFAFEGIRKDVLIRNGIWEEVARTVGNGVPSVYSEVYPANFKYTLQETVNSGRGNPSLGIESHEYRWPIPQSELDINPELKQNSGY